MRLALSSSPDMTDIAPGAIHLWLADPDEVSGELQATYLSLLSAEEKDQQQRFRFERDRRRYLVTRALVRSVLSRYAPVAPCDWSFVKNRFGCPRIAGTFEAAAHIRFNLSHTHRLIVLAVGEAGALGVDVEHVGVRDISIDLADRFFAPDEVEALHEIEANRQKDRFFEYWTFKESYIKARGMGLSIPLDQFSFDLSQSGSVSLNVSGDLGDRASRWQFGQIRLATGHIIALCAERNAEHVTRVSVIRTIPMVWHELQHCSFSRISVRDGSHAGVDVFEDGQMGG